MWRVKRACKSCAAINPVSLWPVRSASKTRNWDSELCFVRTYVYVRVFVTGPDVCIQIRDCGERKLNVFALKRYHVFIYNSTGAYNDAFYSRKISCTLTSLHLSVSHIGQDTVLQVSWVRGLCVLLHLWSGSCNENLILFQRSKSKCVICV